MLPVTVALTLAGARVRSELDLASHLSAAGDQLPVLRGVVELSELIAMEMVAGASATPDLPQRIAAVDGKVADVRRAADLARPRAGPGRELDTALGRLSGLRAGTSGPTPDPVSVTTAYADIVTTLSEIVPVLVSAGGAEVGSAGTARSLIQLRTNLATQEALLRLPELSRPVLAAAGRAAAQETVIARQILRDLPEVERARFASVTRGTAARQVALQATLALAGLPTVLASLATESAALDQLLATTVDAVAATVTARTGEARAAALRDAALVLGALLGALVVALLVGRSLITPVRRLRAAALVAARQELPEIVERVRAGGRVALEDVRPPPVSGQNEIGRLADAFHDMRCQAVRLAGEQAELRTRVSEMVMTISRRSQVLVEQQLSVLEELASDEQDARRLAGLSRLDHLAIRLRRNGENLQVLAGGTPSRPDLGPVSTVDVLRGAVLEVKDYQRISVLDGPNGSVRSHAAADIVHILAELLENAIRFSPPREKVLLTADRGVAGGLLIEVVDGGLGMAAEDLDAANARLAAGHTVEPPEHARRMGLFVVGRLAAPHGLTVRLRQTWAGARRTGITASVHVPGELVGPAPAIAEQLLSGPQPRLPETRVAPVMPPPAATPITGRLGANWFEPGEAVEEPVRKPAADPAEQRPRTTSAGLPARTPGTPPGSAAPRGPAPNQEHPSDLRDPRSIRTTLSRLYDGMLAARLRAAEADDPPRDGHRHS